MAWLWAGKLIQSSGCPTPTELRRLEYVDMPVMNIGQEVSHVEALHFVPVKCYGGNWVTDG